ncbi:hypothetical protein M758_6G050000 [Ceratodon purpureus]|nr:hypothetical protein M758_6G050000 [Ceratodon purpureus]
MGLPWWQLPRSEERGKAAVEALRKELGTEAQELVAFHALEVTSDESVAALAQWLRQTYGGVDILDEQVNNAGIARAETEEELFDTNYYGVKRVINVSSSLGELKKMYHSNTVHVLCYKVVQNTILRAASHYGQTVRGEASQPMKALEWPKFLLSAFTLEAEVQRTSPAKEPRWQHF